MIGALRAQALRARRRLSTELVEQRGGRYLARTPQIHKIEGQRTPPQIFSIIEWPSKEAAEAFYASDEYKPYLERRRNGARNKFVLVAGEDNNNAAHIRVRTPGERLRPCRPYVRQVKHRLRHTIGSLLDRAALR